MTAAGQVPGHLAGMPPWPAMLYALPVDAYIQILACLDWLEEAAETLPDGACPLCPVPEPGQASGVCLGCHKKNTPDRERIRGLCPRCYKKTSRLEDFLYLLATGACPDEAITRVGLKQCRNIEGYIEELRDITHPAAAEAAAA